MTGLDPVVDEQPGVAPHGRARRVRAAPRPPARQSQGEAGRRLPRAAGRRGRRARLHRRRGAAGRRRGDRRGQRLEEADGRRAGASRAAPPFAARTPRRELLRPAEHEPAVGRRDRHERQDLVLAVDRPAADPGGPALRRDRHDRHRVPGRAVHRQPADHAGPGVPAARGPPPARRRRPGARDGGVVDRARPGPGHRHEVRRRAVHEPDARSPRLPRDHGALRSGQGPAVRLAHALARGHQRRRRGGGAPDPAPARTRRPHDRLQRHRGRGRSPAGAHADRREHPPDRRRARLPGEARRRGRCGRSAGGRPLQRRRTCWASSASRSPAA